MLTTKIWMTQPKDTEYYGGLETEISPSEPSDLSDITLPKKPKKSYRRPRRIWTSEHVLRIDGKILYMLQI